MPATYSHYVFGKYVYKKLPAPIRQLIRENKESYLLGLHGPDLLFYFRPLGKNRINQTGVLMHKETALAFFGKGREVYQERPSYVLLSYLLGVLCHFTLDSECHPYINKYMKEHDISHSDIETDLDRELMARDGKDPVQYNCTWHLVRDYDTEYAIASVMDGVTVRQIDESILEFGWSIRMLRCESRIKEQILRKIFAIMGQEREIGGMIMTGREHPACEESRKHLIQQLDESIPVAVGLIREYYQNVRTDEALSERLNQNFG